MKLARSIRLEHRVGSDGHPIFLLLIDGEEFPWCVGLDPVVVEVTNDNCPGIRLTLPAESVEVVHSVTVPATSGAAA